jgi:hypothetical protein
LCEEGLKSELVEGKHCVLSVITLTVIIGDNFFHERLPPADAV